MAATNKTPVLELPQFIGTDKPAWLGDFNPAMVKLDNAHKAVLASVQQLSQNLDAFRNSYYTKTEIANLLVTERAASDAAYLPSNALTGYAKTADVAAKSHTHTTTQVTDFDSKTDARIDTKLAALPSPTSVTSGAYSARPAVASVPNNAIYVCTDLPEQYIKSGGAWVPYGSAGNTLGKAEVAADFVSTAGGGVFEAVPGLSMTIRPGERPLVVIFDGDIGTTIKQNPAIVRITINGVSVARGSIYNETGKDYSATIHMNLQRELAAYPANVALIVRVEVATANGENATRGKVWLSATADNPASLRAVTA